MYSFVLERVQSGRPDFSTLLPATIERVDRAAHRMIDPLKKHLIEFKEEKNTFIHVLYPGPLRD
jgi:hypothetical protein